MSASAQRCDGGHGATYSPRHGRGRAQPAHPRGLAAFPLPQGCRCDRPGADGPLAGGASLCPHARPGAVRCLHRPAPRMRRPDRTRLLRQYPALRTRPRGTAAHWPPHRAARRIHTASMPRLAPPARTSSVSRASTWGPSTASAPPSPRRCCRKSAPICTSGQTTNTAALGVVSPPNMRSLAARSCSAAPGKPATVRPRPAAWPRSRFYALTARWVRSPGASTGDGVPPRHWSPRPIQWPAPSRTCAQLVSHTMTAGPPSIPRASVSAHCSPYRRTRRSSALRSPPRNGYLQSELFLSRHCWAWNGSDTPRRLLPSVPCFPFPGVMPFPRADDRPLRS
jgi:hypothetical protein